MTPYWEWIRSEAALIGTDGCSKVMGFHVECCFEHDLAYYYARDPRDAYRKAHGAYPPGRHWVYANTITRGEADARFRQCHQNRSTFGRYSPMAIYRWLGVKLGGKGAWNRHREREAKAREAAL